MATFQITNNTAAALQLRDFYMEIPAGQTKEFTGQSVHNLEGMADLLGHLSAGDVTVTVVPSSAETALGTYSANHAGVIAAPIHGGGAGSTAATIVATATYTVLATDATVVMTNAAARTANLPAVPNPKEVHTIKDGAYNASGFPITVDGNGETIDGAATFLMDVDAGAITVEYVNGTVGWVTV